MKIRIVKIPSDHRIIITVAICIITHLNLFSQAKKQLVIGEQPVYMVSRATEPIRVDSRTYLDDCAEFFVVPLPAAYIRVDGIYR
jgi:hypothetical protein